MKKEIFYKGFRIYKDISDLTLKELQELVNKKEIIIIDNGTAKQILFEVHLSIGES